MTWHGSGASDSESSGSISTRRRFLFAAGATLGAATLLEGFVLAPNRLSVSMHTIGSPASGADPLRLAVLTDLHLNRLTDFHESVAGAVAEARPDAILIVGDSVDAPSGLPLLREFLQTLPTDGARYATMGNWEYWAQLDVASLRRVYESCDTRLLVNESAELATDALVFGLDDSLAGRPDLSTLPEDAGTLVLSHCPGFRDELRDVRTTGIQAVISGHTHGGQLAIGRWAPIRAPGSGPYVSGWYRDAGPDLFVSRGLGTSIIPVRIGCVPEVALFDWYPA